jgi:hypothetical protein
VDLEGSVFAWRWNEIVVGHQKFYFQQLVLKGRSQLFQIECGAQPGVMELML